MGFFTSMKRNIQVKIDTYNGEMYWQIMYFVS